MNRPTFVHLLLLAALAWPLPSFGVLGDETQKPPPVVPVEGAGLPAPAEQIKEPVPPKPAEPPVVEALLPRPSAPILDQTSVLKPEAAVELSAHLLAARAQGVHVYLLTVPSLGVVPSKQSEKLEALGERYAREWTNNVTGAVVVFDDEGGLMTVGISPEAKRRFSDFVIELAIQESMRQAPESGLARDRLVFASEVVTDALVKLEIKYRNDIGRQRKANIVMTLLALLGLGLVIQSTLRGGKKPAPAVNEPQDRATVPPESEGKTPPSV